MYRCRIHQNYCAWTVWHVDGTHYLEMTNHQHQKGWMSGDTQNGPVLNVVTNYHQRKPGVEIRIGSVSGDGSHSWTKFVRDLTEETRILGDDENNAASTGQPVPQRTRIIEKFRIKADKPAEKGETKADIIFSDGYSNSCKTSGSKNCCKCKKLNTHAFVS